VFQATAFFIVPFAVYFAWRFSYFGYLLPNTFYAKTGGTIYQWQRGLGYVQAFGIHFLLPLLGIFLVRRSPLGASGSGAHHGSSRELLTRGLAGCLAVSVCYTIYIVYVGGDYMAMYRFFVPILPLIYLAVVHGVPFHADSPTSIAMSPAMRAAMCLALAGTLVHSTPLEISLFAQPTMTHGQFRGVETERWHRRRLSTIGRFFRGYRNSQTESVATTGMGAIAYYADMRVFDVFGLQDPVIAHKEVPNMGSDLPGHEREDWLYTLSKNPDYVMFFRDITPERRDYADFDRWYSEGERPNGQLVADLLRRDYEVISEWLEDTENDESGYFTFLQRKKVP
jgi:hypothetical protein